MLVVAELDAVDGTPVLDIKPVMSEYLDELESALAGIKHALEEVEAPLLRLATGSKLNMDVTEELIKTTLEMIGEDGMPDFSLLQELTTGQSAHLVYQAFDLLHLDGQSLLEVPLEDRKRLLRSKLRPHPLVRYAGHVEREMRRAAASATTAARATSRRNHSGPGTAYVAKVSAIAAQDAVLPMTKVPARVFTRCLSRSDSQCRTWRLP